MADHYSAAVDHLADVENARNHLTDLYRIPASDRDQRLVASLHADLGHAMKLAEVHALLDIGQQLRDVRTSIEARR